MSEEKNGTVEAEARGQRSTGCPGMEVSLSTIRDPSGSRETGMSFRFAQASGSPMMIM